MSASALSPELSLILACAHVRARDAKIAAQITPLYADIDWGRFLQLVQRHRVVPLVWKNLSELPAHLSRLVPPEIMNRLEQAYLANSYHILNRARELVQLDDLLKRESIHYLVLKGLPIGLRYYGDPSLRQVGDIDLLVRENDLAHVQRALKRIGFQEAPAEGLHTKVQCYLYRRYLTHHIIYRHPDTGTTLEVHWRLCTNPYLLPLDPLESEHFEDLPLGDITLRAMPDEDLLIYLCVHGDNHAWTLLKWQFDLPQILAARPNLDWAKVLYRAKEQGNSRSLHVGLLLARRLYGVSLPERVVRELEDDRLACTRIGHICPLLNETEESKDQPIQKVMFNLSYTLRMRKGIQYKRFVLLSYCLRPRDWQLIKLPDSLFPLYLLLCPFLILARCLQRWQVRIWKSGK